MNIRKNYQNDLPQNII